MPIPPQALAEIDTLIFKGTHNSYSCRDDGGANDPPLMNHPPAMQIDDFGVWALELDFGAVVVDGQFRAVIGHDRPGNAACFGRDFPRWPASVFLRDFLQTIRDARAVRYRPVLLHFDAHARGDSDNFGDWPTDLDHQAVLELGIAELREVFGPANVVVLSDFAAAHGGRQATVPELAGKAVLFLLGTAPLRSTHEDHCVTWQGVEASIQTGAPAGDSNDPRCAGGCRVFRLDQYQAGWTFEYGVPPNPIVVDAAAPQQQQVNDGDGDDWTCPPFVFPGQPITDSSRGQLVGQKGTYRFPYSTISAAVTRARGTTERASQDPRRAGRGWTILLGPGSYPERLHIDVPLTLDNLNPAAGAARIGSQP
jgi:hypothetical protein